MKTTQNCLQEMVNAIKGVEPNEVAENKTTQTLLREIADAINNETTTDEGKNTQTLLGDITEAIRESGGGSGGETFEVTITAQGEVGSYTWSANKTYLETMAAIQNGDVISVTLIFDEYTGNATGYFIMHTETDDIITVVIDAEDTEDPSTKAISVLKWYSNDTLDAAVYIPQ